MTTRERKERRLARREEWAEKARARANARFGAVRRLADSIPFGQPILVGHHSERHARRDAERIHDGMSKGCEAQALAQHHTSKASGIALQLKISIYADDVDAVEKLRDRIRKLTETADHHAAINRAWRKCKGDVGALVASGIVGPKLAETICETMRVAPWLRVPLDTTNLRADIRRNQQRLEEILHLQELRERVRTTLATEDESE